MYQKERQEKDGQNQKEESESGRESE